MLLMGLNRSLAPTSGEEQATRLNRDILRRVGALPGFDRRACRRCRRSAAPGRDRDDPDRRAGGYAPVRLDTVTAGYFATLGIRTLRGRAFGAGDAPTARGWLS